MPENESPRRSFLKTAATGILILKPATVFGSQANSNVEVGLIGCGGRGNWIAPFFPEHTGARVVALADVVKEHLDTTAATVQSRRVARLLRARRRPPAGAIELDAVVIETPTFYHAEQALAAVEAGKHVYMAKPVAVDVPGCKSVLASGAKAPGEEAHLLGGLPDALARRLSRNWRRACIAAISASPSWRRSSITPGRPSKDRGTPGMDPGQRRMSNFYMDKVLGGDIIVEQNIHVIDVANWLLQGHPTKAYGSGGRTDWRGTGYDAGDAWDHFLVQYHYANSVHADFSSNQLTNSFSDLCVRLFGIDGCADSHYGGLIRITGKNAWMGAEKDDTFKGGAVENVKLFVASIREGKPIYNYEESVRSNLTAILGRTAAYLNREVTWDEINNSTEKWTADLKLRW